MFNPKQLRDPRTGKWIKAGGSVVNPVHIPGGNSKIAFSKGPLTVFKPGHKPTHRVGRGKGLTGLKQNTVPYVRVNKRSQTVGVNAGTIVTASHRIVVGGYIRKERFRGRTAVDKFTDKLVAKVFPTGTKGGKAIAYLRKNTEINKPVRYASMKTGPVGLV